MSISTLLISFVSLSFVPSGDAGPARGHPNELKGEWVLLETADEKRPDRGNTHIRMVIQGNAVTMTFAGLETNRGTVEIGLLKGTPIINVKLENGRTVLGIYDCAGDTLTICFDDVEQGRPMALAPVRTQWMEKWKRVKP